MPPLSFEDVSALVEAIPAGTLSAQRWFGGKGRIIAACRLKDFAEFPDASGSELLTLMEVHFRDGPAETYFVPLAIHASARAKSAEGVLTKARIADHEQAILDGLADAQWCRHLLDLLRLGSPLAGRYGRFLFEPTSAFDGITGALNDAAAVRPLPAEQSNTLVSFADRALLKCFRRAGPGINPDLEVGTFLTTRTGFRNIPRVAGTITYLDERQSRWPLAVVQSYIPNRGNAWNLMLQHLRDYYRVALEGRSPGGTISEQAALIRRLGERTGQLHVALTSVEDEPAFAPVPASAEDQQGLMHSVARELPQTLALLRDRRNALPSEFQASCDQVLGAETELSRLAKPQADVGEVFKIRIHGDYHLGQVLVTGDDFVIIDFEGEPLRPVEERRAKQFALRDVAGLLRSLNYASFAGLFEVMSTLGAKHGECEASRVKWEEVMRAAFVEGYRRTAAAARVALLPRTDSAMRQLLALCELEKALYELRYELDNRPDWVRIPLSGIRQIVGP